MKKLSVLEREVDSGKPVVTMTVGDSMEPLLFHQSTREKQFSREETEMLFYYFTSGVYGTMEHRIRNHMQTLTEKKTGKLKLRYLWERLFPGKKVYERDLSFCKYRWLYPIGWGYRILSLLANKQRRKQLIEELKIAKRCKSDKKITI